MYQTSVLNSDILWRNTNIITVELQWLEHLWLVYNVCFELVIESLGKNPIAVDIILGWFSYLYW